MLTLMLSVKCTTPAPRVKTSTTFSSAGCVPTVRRWGDLWIFSKNKKIGTIFDQRGQTCRWWYLVDCQQSEIFYNFVEEEFQEDTNGRN